MMGWAKCGRCLAAWAGVLGCACLFAEVARGDLQIAGYDDRWHDRFYDGPNRDFIGEEFDWSGIGRVADPSGASANWKQLTMISPNYFITANHNQPTLRDDGDTALPVVRFYRTNDPDGEFWETTLAVSGNEYVGSRIESTDLWVGKLAETPPGWVMRYPLAKRHLATNYLSYTDNDLFIFGQDSPRSFTSVRVGRNAIDTVTTYGTYEWSYNPAGFGPHEAQTVSGDSGGPSFFIAGGLPVLAGIHTSSNYDTGVTANLDAIAAAVGEPIGLSTGLAGDVDGDFAVSPLDQYDLLLNWGRTNAQYYNGDLNGDHVINQSDMDVWVRRYGERLYAPADFTRDGKVDGKDLGVIGSNWLQPVSLRTNGDANGDGFVNVADLDVFEANEFRAFFGELPVPLVSILGDLTGDGLVNGFDLGIVTSNLNQAVPPGTKGDVDGNGIVDFADHNFISSRLGNSFGDLNGDKSVGVGDFTILAANWGQTVLYGYRSGDLNGDRRVDVLDAEVLFGWWGVDGSGKFPSMMVPEPSAAVLMLVSVSLSAGLARRRRGLRNCAAR